jgi:Carboxypeptidase regulatory-like domain
VSPRSRLTTTAILLPVVLGTLALGWWILVSDRGGGDELPASSREPSADSAPIALPVPPDVAAPQSLLSTTVGNVDVSISAQATTGVAEPAPEAEAAPTRSLTVVVVDGVGRTVRDALVEFFDAPRGELAFTSYFNKTDPTWNPPVLTWTTVADGSAHGLVAPTRMLLAASHETLGASHVVTLDSADAGPVPTSVRLELAPRALMRGRVLDISGLPAVGASVVFERTPMPDEGHGRPRIPKPVAVDADGRFEVAVDPPFIARVYAERGNRRTLRKYASAMQGRCEPIELRFAGGYAVKGVVTGPTGEPQAGAEVDVTGGQVHVDPVETDDDGRFLIELAEPGHIVVFASAKGLLPDVGVGVMLSDDQQEVHVTLGLVEPVTISGSVQFSDGTAIEGASLLAQPMKPYSSGDADRADVRAWASRSAEDRALALSVQLFDHASSTSDGRFSFRDIHPRYAMDIRCWARDQAAIEGTVKAVQPGAQDVLVVLERVEPGQDRLRGRVLDAQSRAPIARCDLTCARWLGGEVMPWGGEHVAVEDADGRFEVSGLNPQQEYGFLVEAVGYPATSVGPFRPSAGAEIELLVGHVGSLRIAVTDTSGAARAGASVQLLSGSTGGFSAMFTEILTRETGADGLLDWPDLKPGEYSLEAVVGKQRAPRMRVDVQAGQPVLVELVVRESEHLGALQVSVKKEAGEAWPDAQVQASLLSADGASSGLDPIHLGRTDAEGRILLEGLAPGKYLVRIRSSGPHPMKHAEVGAEGTTTVELGPSP